jgi:predicted Zn-dependent peptidase
LGRAPGKPGVVVDYTLVTLPNGLRLITAPMSHVRSVSIECFFAVGSRYEAAELAGVSHFIEHMLFKGSERYPTAQAISETIEGVGGILDAATDREVTVYSAKVASHHLDLALGLLADMILYPRFDPAELEKERRVIIEELSMYHDSPQDWVHVLADATLWPGGLPLGRDVAGSRETVRTISRAQMLAYKAAHYTPGALVISVAGDTTHEAISALVDQLFGDWAPGPAAPWEPCPPPADARRVTFERRETEQTNLSLIMPGVAQDAPDYYDLVVLNAILGDGMSSRLFQRVREEQGLAYDVGSGAIHYRDTGAFVVTAGVEPSHADEALVAILAELARMRDEPVPDAELTRAREYSRGRMTLRLEDTHSVASWLGGQEILLNRIYDLDEVLAELGQVTAERVQQLAGKLFHDEWLRLALIGPHESAQEFEKLLYLPS